MILYTIDQAINEGKETIKQIIYNCVIITHEPRARDSGAKGPREYWWEAPSLGSNGGKQGSLGGNPRAKGNTGIKGLLGILGKGVQKVCIYRRLASY